MGKKILSISLIFYYTMSKQKFLYDWSCAVVRVVNFAMGAQLMGLTDYLDIFKLFNNFI